MRPLACLLTAAFACGLAAAPRTARRIPLHRRIELLLATPEAQTGRWGLHVVHARSKRTLFERNAGDRFTPASNTKLFSTALALERLGPAYRFETFVTAAAGPDGDGRLPGDLRIVGGGDPTLSGREYPYRKDGEDHDPAEPIAGLADQILKAGVKVIAGDIVGDDRRYIHQPYPEGWTVDDAIWGYGAAVSALPFNDGMFALTVNPAEETGDLAAVVTNPPMLPMVLDNRVVTVEEGETKIEVDRAPGSRQVRVMGVIVKGGRAVKERAAVEDPALYAAFALYDLLTRQGVRILGRPVSVHRHRLDEPYEEAPGIVLARRQSPPLSEIARTLNKVSQNLHAEILLRETALTRRGEPTREAGLKELTEFLETIGIPETACHFEDGSGLSRRTLISPRAITTLLGYMDSTVHREEWESMLPIGGEDGTLDTRFDRVPAARAIHAKTGTLATVNALSGYVTTLRGERLTFSIIANNFSAKPREIRRVIDRIGLALVAWEGM